MVSESEMRAQVGKRCLVHQVNRGDSKERFAIFTVTRVDVKDGDVRMWGGADEWNSSGDLANEGYIRQRDLLHVVECPDTQEARDALMLLWSL